MLDVLAPLFGGDFARYREVLVLRDDPREAIAGRDFLNPQTLEALMARFRPEFVGEDPRGLASLWSGNYFVRLIPPVVSAALLLNRRLPLDMEQLAIVVDAAGVPVAFRLADHGEEFPATPPNPFERFHHLIEDNLAPFIQALSASSGLPAKVLWSNAGNYFEWTLGQLAMRVESPAVLADGEALLKARLTPDGRRNPLHEPIRYVEVAEPCGELRLWRQRRLCCIRYLLPGVGLCPNCPRLERPPRE